MKRITITFSLLLVFVGVFLINHRAKAYGDCSGYGIMAYSDYGDSCKCMSGYVFGKDILGNTSCVSGTSLCYEKYGYGATFDSLSNSCSCSYGYVFGKDSIGRTQCVTPDSICTDELGYNATYDSLSDKCKCRYGYVISGGRCTDGNGVCRAKHGLYSSYDDLSNSCECDSGYTLDNSGQCVQKQNNAYFTLKELNTDDKRAIIKSDYDYRYYLISYNYGCYASSFRRYINHQIVVNLGTDFDLDSWDKIVLQDDNEVCDITRVERADSGTTLEPEEEVETFYYVPQTVTTPQPIYQLPPAKIPEIKKEFKFDETKKATTKATTGTLNTQGALRKCPSTTLCDVVKYYAMGTQFNILGSYDSNTWYSVSLPNSLATIGWIHSSILEIDQEEVSPGLQIAPGKKEDSKAAPKPVEPINPWYKRLWNFLF